MEKKIKKAFLLGLVVSLLQWPGSSQVEAQDSEKIERLEKKTRNVRTKGEIKIQKRGKGNPYLL